MLVSKAFHNNYNITTRYPFLRLSNTEPSYTYSLSFLTERQYRLLVKKNCWTLGIRGILVRQEKPSCLIVPKPTDTLQTYYLVWM